MIKKQFIFTILISFLMFNTPILRVNALDKFKFIKSNPKLGTISVNDTYFNLKDYDLVTSIKNQYNTNACWAFATNASIESNLLINNYYYNDLSEAHLELATQNTYKYNRLTFNREANTGGNYNLAASYLMNGWGAIEEASLPFVDLINLYNENKPISEDKILNVNPEFDVNSIAFIGSGSTCNTDVIKDIKEYLITNGALAASVYADNTNVFRKYNYYNGLARKDINGDIIPGNQDVNHGVTIIGWDDTISKEKFSSINPPTRDGAFIIKNSYGEIMNIGTKDLVKRQLYANYRTNLNINSIDEINDARLKLLLASIYEISEDEIFFYDENVYLNIGDKGFEYISYDDIYICKSVVGFFDASKDVEDYTYYYDDLGYNATYEIDSKEISLINFFDKKSLKNEQLEEIAMYFPKINQRYEVFFANGIESNINNAIKIGEGEINFVGYNTLDIFDKPIINSDKYSILIKIIDNDNIELGVSYPIDGTYSTMKMKENVQYISIDGINFVDTTNLKDNKFQLTIKVATNETDKQSDLLEHNNSPKNIKSTLFYQIDDDKPNNILSNKLIYLWQDYNKYIIIGLGVLLFASIVSFLYKKLLKNR